MVCIKVMEHFNLMMATYTLVIGKKINRQAKVNLGCLMVIVMKAASKTVEDMDLEYFTKKIKYSTMENGIKV